MYGVWYQKKIAFTEENCAGRVFLHFGAVDYQCQLFVNGETVGDHRGGYVSFKFEITQVIGLTNDDAVSKEFRPYKQMIERLNRTYKASYRPTNGFDNYDGANYDLALWVAYYNFLRPHKQHRFQPPVRNDVIANVENMPGKWQLLIFLGQQTIKKMQETAA